MGGHQHGAPQGMLLSMSRSFCRFSIRAGAFPNLAESAGKWRHADAGKGSKDQILIKAKGYRKAQISKSQSSEQRGKLAQIYSGPRAALLQNSLLLILYSGASIKEERKVNNEPQMAEDYYLRRGRPAQMFLFTTR